MKDLRPAKLRLDGIRIDAMGLQYLGNHKP
jgi:hypothetical protein